MKASSLAAMTAGAMIGAGVALGVSSRQARREMKKLADEAGRKVKDSVGSLMG